MGNIYEQHKDRISKIKNKIDLIEIWECEFDQMCKLNSELVEFIKKNPFLCLNSDIKPRDALFGGRVNASKLYHKCSSDEKIKHYDIRSLYPYVQKYGIFPFGHQKIINSNFESIDKYFGLINCTVLPPRNLLFPILPIKTKNKLLFTLCSVLKIS